MDYKSWHTQTTSSPLKPVENRQLTDVFFILLIPINLSLWLGFGIYSFISSFDYYSHQKVIPWGVVTIVVAASVFFTILPIFLSSKLRNKSIVFAVIVFIVAVIVNAIVILVTQLYTFIKLNAFRDHIDDIYESKLAPVLLTFSLLVFVLLIVMCLIYHAIVFVYTTKDTALLSQMINEASQAIIGSSPALLFSLLIVTLLTIIWWFNALFITLQLSKALSEYSASSHLEYKYLFLLCLFSFEGTYVFNVIWNFGFMVVSDYFADYYSSSGNQKKPSVLRSIAKVSRYHLGTVAFFSIPILPSTCALVVAVVNNYQNARQSSYVHRIANFISKVCVFIDISDYASIQTAIHGSHFFESTKKMLDLHHSNSVLFLIANAVYFKVAQISITFAVITGLTAQILFDMYFYGYDLFEKDFAEVEFYLGIHGFWILSLANCACNFFVRPAMCTFSIFKLASLRESGTPKNNAED